VNVDGIILAAGTSTRFGATKQLMHWTGNDGITRPLVRHISDIALQSNLRYVYLIIGHDSEGIRTAIASITSDQRLRIVDNKNFRNGQSTSVHAGIAALSSETDAAMFILCDQPKISPALINDLIGLYEQESPLVCAPVANGRRGNPVIFSKQLFSELSQITGDKGGRSLIRKYWDRASKVELKSDDVFMDIDSINDLPTR
jgi:molybdenum cofactor cytidylyltransferase